MKKLFFTAMILSVIGYENTSIAGTYGDTCSAKFPSITCSAWNEDTEHQNAKICACEQCPTSKPNLVVKSGSTSDNYMLYSGCECNTCSCLNNPTTTKTNGSCSCKNGVADYSTCTAGTTTYYLCSDSASGGCHAPSVTINGVTYCATSTSSGCSTAAGVTASYTMARFCSNYLGVGAKTEGCFVFGCSGTGLTPSDDRKSCVCNKGYYGNASSGCTKCPSSGGIDGTTVGINTTDITGCYIPADESMSDSIGTFHFSEPCFYSN